MDSVNSSKPHVLIAGAGLGGLALAQALRKQGISYQIFERSTASRAQGYAIGIHSILQELVAAFPTDMPSPTISDHLLPLDLPAQIIFYDGHSLESRIGVEATDRQDIIRANRQRLRDWLATNIPVQYGKAVESFEEDSESVRLHFADGTSATGDYLVGADGSYSRVRRGIFSKLGLPDSLSPLPLATIVGETTLAGADFERQLELANSCYVAGYRSDCSLFVGLNSVSADGKSGRYYWSVSYRDESARQRPNWIAAASREDLYSIARRKLDKLNPRFLEVLDKTDPSGIVLPPLKLQDIELLSLPVSRVTLLGDAAHCMTPFRGEGGINAMRDSMNLAQTIARIAEEHTGLQGWKLAVDEYQKEMLARGVKSVRLSRASGEQPPTAEDGPRYVWGHLATELPHVSVSLAAIPHIKA